MNAWLLVLLASLTVARLTRLLHRDTITEPLRAWVQHRAIAAEDKADARLVDLLGAQVPAPHPSRRHSAGAWWRARYTGFWPWLDDLLGCPWCVSMWVGAVVGYVTVWFPSNRFVLGGLVACSASLVAAWIMLRESVE